MIPLSVRILRWPDVPEEWRDALGVECERVMFVPADQHVGLALKGRLPDTAADLDGGAVFGWLETAPTDGIE